MPPKRSFTAGPSRAPSAGARGYAAISGVVGQGERDRGDIARRIGLLFGLTVIFLRFSMLHEALTQFAGANLYVLYLAGPPAYLGILFSGGLRRSYRARPTWYWTAFFLWMAAATPFSVWRGESAKVFYTYIKTEFPMLLIVAGLVLTWSECRRVMHVIALSAICYLAIVLVFGREDQGRVSLLFGSTSNSNDLAAQCLLVLPFVLFLVLDARKLLVLRLAALTAVLFGLGQILETGSRGGLVALAAALLFMLVCGTARLRLGVVALVAVGLILAPMLLSKDTLQRLLAFGVQAAGPEEAAMSMSIRESLARKGVDMTLRSPIFGQGPGQFDVADDIISREAGERRGDWLNAHNVYLKISAECGVPALIFYLAAIVSSFLLLLRTHRKARQNPRHRQIATATFCVMLSMVGFCTAMAFLNMAYSYQLPAISGLAIAMAGAAAKEFAAGENGASGVPEAATGPGVGQAKTWGFVTARPALGGRRQAR